MFSALAGCRFDYLFGFRSRQTEKHGLHEAGYIYRQPEWRYVYKQC